MCAEKFSEAEIYSVLHKGLSAQQTALLREAAIAIAGAGGLGSNIAVHLARLGVGKLILIDFDRVELSNLNRQHYFLADVGDLKVTALARHLRAINPQLKIITHAEKITRANIMRLTSPAKIICEALDDAQTKALLVSEILSENPAAKIIAASGIAGFANADNLKTRRVAQNFYLCGDGVSNAEQLPLCGARVAICAAMQALTVARLILGLEE